MKSLSITERFKKSQTPIPKSDSKSYWEKFIKDLECRVVQSPLERSKIFEEACDSKDINNLKTIISCSDIPLGKDLCEIWSPTTRSSTDSLIYGLPLKTDLEVNEPSFRSQEKIKHQKNSKNPYWNFFNRPPHKQQPWRPERQQALAPEPKIKEKGERALQKILEKIRAFTQIFGDKCSEFDSEETLASLFDLVFDELAVSSVTKLDKILPSVPMSVAQELNMLKASVEERIRQECNKSIALSKKPERIMAFGHSLEAADQFIPPLKKLMNRWRIPIKNEDLHTLATVFRGIENLNSTKAFCNWLYRHQEYRKFVPYIESLGLITKKTLQAKKGRRTDKLRSRFSMSTKELGKNIKQSSALQTDEQIMEGLEDFQERKSSKIEPTPEMVQQVNALQKVADAGKKFKKIVTIQ